MSYLSVERMTGYGVLLEEKVRLYVRQGEIAQEARRDFEFRMFVEAWEDADLKDLVLTRLNQRVADRMDQNRELDQEFAANRAARRAWHREALNHIHNIVCPVCSSNRSASNQQPSQQRAAEEEEG